MRDDILLCFGGSTRIESCTVYYVLSSSVQMLSSPSGGGGVFHLCACNRQVSVPSPVPDTLE